MSSTTTGIVRIDRSGLRHRTDLLGWRMSARINRARFVDAICSAVCSTNTGQLDERLCAPHKLRLVFKLKGVQAVALLDAWLVGRGAVASRRS